MKKLKHGMILDAKSVMDNALPDLEEIRTLVPQILHEEFDKLVANFEDTLCSADVSKDYEERSRRGKCGMRYHADDCECGGMGGDR